MTLTEVKRTQGLARAAVESLTANPEASGRVGIEPAPQRLLDPPSERDQRPLLAAATDELYADGEAGVRAHHRNGNRREAERVRVRAERKLAPRAGSARRRPAGTRRCRRAGRRRERQGRARRGRFPRPAETRRRRPRTTLGSRGSTRPSRRRKA